MKIAISGAGVAGCALAHWLLRYGHEPTLIEVSPSFRDGGYIIDFWGIGYSIIERMGLLAEVRSAGYQVKEVRFVGDDGARISGFSVASIRHLVQDAFTSLPRGDLARLIYQSIESRAETLFGNSITALSEGPAGVDIVLTSGTVRRFDLVIGADGLHSNVRSLVFGPQGTFERELGYCVAAFEARGYRPRDELVYVSHADPGRQVSRFALHDDRSLFLLVFTAALLDDPIPEELSARKATLQRVFAGSGWETAVILEQMHDAESIYFDRVSQIEMPAWTKGRIALVGDAASCVSLLAGEGTGLGITAAYVLAGEVERAGGNYLDAFAAYERRLRSFIEKKQQSARDFAGTFVPKTELGIWVRNQAMKLMVLPKLADLLIGSSLKDDIDLPAYDR